MNVNHGYVYMVVTREQSSGQAGSGGLVPSAGFDPQVLTGSRGLQEWWWVPRGQCRGETSRGNEA